MDTRVSPCATDTCSLAGGSDFAEWAMNNAYIYKVRLRTLDAARVCATRVVEAYPRSY